MSQGEEDIDSNSDSDSNFDAWLEGVSHGMEESDDEQQVSERCARALAQGDVHREEAQVEAQGEEVKERTYRVRQQVPVTQEQVDNDPDLDLGEEDLPDGEYEFDWGDLGFEGEVEEDATYAHKEGEMRTVARYGSMWLCTNKVSVRPREKDHAWFEFSDGKREIVEIRSFFSDNRTGTMMCEVYHHHSDSDLHRIPYFNKKSRMSDHAYTGWNAKCELVQEGYPTPQPVSALRERVLVSRNLWPPFSGTPLGGAEYFYRYRCDQIKNEMFAPLTLGICT